MLKSRIVVTLVIICFPGSSLAQKVEVGLGGGVSFIQTPGHFALTIPEGGLGWGTNFSIMAKGRMDFAQSPFSLTTALAYAFLEESGSYSSPLGRMASGHVEAASNQLTLSIGGEVASQADPVRPYLALDLLLTYLDKGSYTLTNLEGETFRTSSPAQTSVGVALGPGFRWQIGKALELDAYARYAFRALGGTYPGGDNYNTIDVATTVLYKFP